MILGENITKDFGEQKIFDKFSFRIEDGEFVCFSGESGAGKTTLLNIIGLLEPIDSGRLLINGKEYKGNRERRDFYRYEVGFLFQNFALIENKTVRQNLDIVMRDDQSGVTIEGVLERVGLADKIDKQVYVLSGGEQQRIALARLMLKPCKVILADEPTGSLDRANAAVVMELLKALNREGKTLVIVTHDDAVKAQADRIIEL